MAILFLENYQAFQPCIACGTMAVQRCFHHIKTRGSGGTDEAHNLLPVCLKHHIEVHNIGLTSFSIKFESVECWLKIHNWNISDQKWRHI